jgi:WD40 repeat protein
MHTKAKVLQLETESQSFCALAVDRESNHMVTLPSRELSVCNVRDLRQSPTSSPVAKLEASGGSGKDHGMLLSLALRDSIVACGLEDGNVFFHDLRKPSVACGIKLASSFILGLDLAPSAEGSIVAVAGVAGNAEDLRDLPESEQGTIALIKCMTEPSMRAQVRSRVGTCSLVGDGKPGVDVGMFRPDGRLFAIGGWDRRVRLFDRRTASLLAIMKGHHDSVRALDWATDSLLVSGDNRGTIHIWNVEIS